MRRAHKILSVVLVIALILTVSPALYPTEVIGAGISDMNLDGARDEDNNYLITDSSVTLEWNAIPGAANYVISRQDLGIGGNINVTGVTHTVTGLEPNNVYEFIVTAQDNLGATIATTNNTINVLTGDMSFSAGLIYEPIAVNGESGLNPGMVLQWEIPKIWDGVQFSTIDSNKIDYLVTAGTDKTASNMGNYEVYYDGGVSTDGYDVKKQGESVSKLVYEAEITGGVLSYEWWRYSDFEANVLNDGCLNSGTVYYLRVYPQFNTNPSNPNNTPIGHTIFKTTALDNGYICTPLHVSIGKDSNNNVLCSIDRINYDSGGGADIINFKYEVYSSPHIGMISPELEGYEYEQYGDQTKPIEIFLPRKNVTATYYYKVYAKSDNYDNIESTVVRYTQAADEGVAPIPQNLSVTGTKLITSGTDKGASVDLRWNKPIDFDTDELRYYVYISMNKADTTTDGGAYYQEVIAGQPYDVRYRTIAVLEEDDLDLSESGYINYTLNGLNLLQDYDGFGDEYPAQLRLNKIYYIKIASQKVTGGPNSDYSLPVSVTTPSETRTPQSPELFAMENYGTDFVDLIWQKVTLDMTKYNLPGSTNYSVTYDIYMGNSIERDEDGNYTSFEYLGNYPDTPSPGLNYNARRARVSDLTSQPNVVARFGNSIVPDTTYYFIIKTKVDIEGVAEPLYSLFSYVVPVTTKRTEIVEPGDDTIKPASPLDFAIYTDSDGNPAITSSSVKFTWTEVKDGLIYRLIRTAKSIDQNATLSELQTDDTYSFMEYEFDSDFEPSTVGEYVYSATGLDPNAIYYYSLRTERLDETAVVEAVSPWITLSVTTSLLEVPTELMVVRDGSYDIYTQLKIQFKSIETYGAQIYIRSQGEDSYSEWSNVVLSYNKPSTLSGTDLRITSATLRGLDSNTSYSIKVRATYMPEGNSVINVSKFAGPVIARTEFNQTDYDEEQEEADQTGEFKAYMKDIKTALFWILESTEDTTSIKLRADLVNNLMASDNSKKLTINLGYLERSDEEDKVVSDTNQVIIPYSIIQQINRTKESIVIKAGFGDMIIRPGMIDDKNAKIASLMNTIAEAEGRKGDIKDIYVQIKLESEGRSSSEITTENELSDVTVFTLEAMGMNETDSNIETEIDNELEKVITNQLKKYLKTKEKDRDTTKKVEALLKKYKMNIIEEMGENVADIVDDATEEGPDETSILSGYAGFNLKTDTTIARTYYSGYQLRDKKWIAIPTDMDQQNGYASFEVKRTGKIVVLKNVSKLSLTGTDTAKNQIIQNLDARYGISDAFNTSTGVFNAQTPITLRQTLAVLNKVLGLNSDEENISKETLAKLKTNTAFGYLTGSHKLTREESAYLASRLYALKTGVSDITYKPSKNIILEDYKSISPAYYKAVLMAVDLKIITPDATKKILPKNQINADDELVVLSRTLTILGEL